MDLDGDKKLTNPRRTFLLIVASIRHPWSTRWHEIHGLPSSPTGSIRIQLSSFRNNCYRFPTAMLHFQVFTSTSPLSSPSTVPPFRPFHSPYPSPPSLSLSLSPLPLSYPHPTLPLTLYLSLPFFRRDNISLAIARSRLPSLVDEHADSLASEYLRVHHECSPRLPLSRSSSSSEDFFVLRGLRISSRHNGRLTDTRPLCFSLLDTDGVRKRDKKRDKERERKRETCAFTCLQTHVRNR